ALLEARVQTAGEEQAKALLVQVKALRTFAEGALVIGGLKGGEQGKAAQQASKLLSQLKLEQQGADLTASMKADAAGVLGALGAMPALPGVLRDEPRTK